jgi:tetraprenyl-beta-curcumene synthase
MRRRRISRDGRVRRGLGGIADGLSLSGIFARAALRYWLAVFPRVALELRHWRRRAARIDDPALRRLALDALGKRGNMEGAAAFATLVRRRHRRSVVRALVAFQAIYNHADMLAEQPDGDPVGNARALHEALLVALDPGVDRPAHSARGAGCEDGGYLAEMVDRCHVALSRLPSYASAAATPARRAAARIVAFQSLSLGELGELESWARRQAPASGGLEWWETAAAAGSSLGVHALIAAAASPMLRERDVAAIEAAYFPCIGALHSLLDSLVDEAEDAATGQLRLLDCYPSPLQAAAGVRRLAETALTAARELPGGRAHALLVAAMACSYLAAPEASTPGAQAVARAARASVGRVARPMLLVFEMRRQAGRLASVFAATSPAGQKTSAPARVDTVERGADARAA